MTGLCIFNSISYLDSYTSEMKSNQSLSKQAEMKIIFSILFNIFVVIKSNSLLEGKVDGQILPSVTISYAVTIIYYKDGVDKEFSGVAINKLSVLTVGHQARLINPRSCESSDLPDMYDAWIVFKMGRETSNPSIDISTIPDIVAKRSQVVDVKVLDENPKRGSSPNIAVLTFYDPDQYLWARPVNYARGNCVIEGEAYYDVQELLTPLRESTVGIRIRKDFAIFKKEDCYILYGIYIEDTQFCGKTEKEIIFLEDEEGAGLIQDEKVIGVASHSQVGQLSGKLVDIIIFEKVGLHSAFILEATGRGLGKSMSLTGNRMDEIIRTYKE